MAALHTRDYLARSFRETGGFAPADKEALAARFPAEAQAVYEIQIRPGGPWSRVSEWIFRSWTGGRRVNGETYAGPVFLLGTGTAA